jgi:hypothetical protein
MGDDLKKAEAIGSTVNKPRIDWHRSQDLAAADPTEPLPIYVALINAKVSELMVVLGGSYTGSPGDASLNVVHMRGGSPINSTNMAFQAAWANAKTVIGTPGWDLEPDDILLVEVAKAGGVVLPSLMLRVTTEPS